MAVLQGATLATWAGQGITKTCSNNHTRAATHPSAASCMEWWGSGEVTIPWQNLRTCSIRHAGLGIHIHTNSINWAPADALRMCAALQQLSVKLSHTNSHWGYALHQLVTKRLYIVPH